MSEKSTKDLKNVNKIIGSIGAIFGIIVFIAYIPQIISNIQGVKSQPWQPLVASVSCSIWVLYGLTKQPKKDILLVIPNLFGVVLGFITFITSL
ncbi:MAG: SemiSWEET family transporter [Vagococcus sp.]|uniref:SemiSWEET family transporter n=1 Tax=Vagococcus sp. TaxID=1933889 RepID=UPI002FC60101